MSVQLQQRIAFTILFLCTLLVVVPVMIILVIIFVPYSFFLFKTDGTATQGEFICSKCHMSINWGDPYCAHCGDKLDYD